MLETYTYNPDILDCLKQRIDLMIAQHCKVLFVRFDLRFPAGTVHNGSNTEVAQCMKELTGYYNYHGVATRYIWVREQWSSDAPHYHVMMLLNGSRVQNPMGVWAKAADLWSRITNGPHALLHQCRQEHVGQVTSGCIMIRRPSGAAIGHDLLAQKSAFEAAYREALECGAYLAKDFSKGKTPFRVREYGASRQ